MADFKIQRGSFDFGASEDTDTVTLGTAVASLNVAFARITGIRFASGGPAAGDTADRNNDDLGVTCLLTATDTITFTRQSSGVDEDVRVYWEVIEGPASGPNAIVVRYHDNVTMANGIGQIDQAVSGISTLGDCVPFICGLTNNNTSMTWPRVQVTAKMVDVSGDKVRLDRVAAVNTTLISVAVVEFIGANWIVQNNIEHNYTAAGTNETETITDVVDVAHAFVACGHRFNGGANDELGYNCWFVNSTTLGFRIEDSAASPSDDYTVAHVVRNDGMTVEHLFTTTLGGSESAHPAGSSSPQSLTTTVTAVSDTAQTSLFATADDANSAVDFPQPFWLYRLTDTDEVTWWRGRHGSVAEWVLQVVRWPDYVPPSDFRVQRGSFDFGASEDSDTVTIIATAAGRAFARITGVRFSSGGPAAGTVIDRNNDDIGVTCLLTATNTITFTRESGGENEDVRVYWEVIEFPSTGDNVAVVRYHDNVTMVDTATQVDQAVSGISTLDDCVPFLCGVTNDETKEDWDRVQVTAKMVDASGNKVRLDRVDGVDKTVVSVAVVEFTGANWIVQNNIEHNYSNGGSNEIESITDVVDTSHAFVVCGHRCDGEENDELGYNCWFKDSNELYFRIEGSATSESSDYTVAHVVRNDSMTVQHLDSITGSGTDHPVGSGSPQSIATTVTAVSDMARTMLLASADDGDTQIDYPEPHWLYRLTANDEVTWWRAHYGSVADWALQVVQLPGGVSIEEGAGSSSGTGAATGDGIGIATADGDAAGTSTATADGEAIATCAGSSDGTSTATADAVRVLPTDGSSIGASTAIADGEALATAAGSAAGAATATADGVAVTSAAGASTGAATVTGDGESIATAVGSAAGVGAATGAGVWIDYGAGSAGGSSTAAAEGKTLAQGDGSSTGAATATATGKTIGTGAGASDGVATAAATSKTIGAGAGTSAGTGAAAGTGQATAQAAGSSTGAATAAADGVPVLPAVGASAGVGVATADGEALALATGTAAGTSTAMADGESTAAGVGSSAGVGAATADALAIATGVGSSSGVATAAATGQATAEADGASAGSATTAATGVGVIPGAGSAAGVGTAAAVGEDASGGGIEEGVGAAAGSSTATADGEAIAKAAGASAGSATATAVGAGVISGAGSSAGTSTAAAAGAGIIEGSGSSAGLAVAAAVALAFALGMGAAAGVASAAAVSETIAAGDGVAAGTSTAAAVGESVVEGVGTAAGTSSAAAVGEGPVVTPGRRFDRIESLFFVDRPSGPSEEGEVCRVGGCLQLCDELGACEMVHAMPVSTQTTSDVPATLYSLALADDSAVAVTACIVAMRSDGSERALYEREALAYRSGGGAALQGAVETPITKESDPTWDCTIDVSGNNVRVRGTGPNAPVDWRGQVKIQRIT